VFIKQCGTSGFDTGIIQFLRDNYHNPELDKLMDENRDVIAFSDKLLVPKTMELRDIQPEDYISLTTGYPFPTERFPEARVELLKLLNSCFPNEDTVKALLQQIASSLYGCNKFERFNVWTGAGGNGKGLVSDLLKQVFGSYYHPIQSAIITKPSSGKNDHNGPLAMCKGKRFVQTEEPESTDKIQVGLVKEMTGGCEITTRAIRCEAIKFIMSCPLWLNANSIPLANKIDGGYKRRIRIILFPFNFVDNPTLPHERKGDTSLKKKVQTDIGWRTEMLYLLFEAFAEVEKNGGLLETPEMLEAVEEYLDANNPVKVWLKESWLTNLPAHDNRFWVGADDMRTLYMDAKHTKISHNEFKHLMSQCEMKQEKYGHPFNAMRWDGERWTDTECGAGRYWVGLMPVKAPHPDTPIQTIPRNGANIFLPETDISGAGMWLSTLRFCE
jgi:P4 family phage/plasmid primase-like protien